MDAEVRIGRWPRGALKLMLSILALAEGLSSDAAAASFSDANWTPVGSGMDATVYALAVSGTNLYAGGYFTEAGGTPAMYVAKWDGNSWRGLNSSFGGAYPIVEGLAVSGNSVFAGGSFTNAGGIAATNIARWDGTGWSALGSGLSGTVYVLASSGSNVYAGGAFTTAGGGPANYVARWDGSQWWPLGSGVNQEVYALAVSGSDLYAGGSFTTAGGGPAKYVAKWDGSSWTALGGGLNGRAYALAVSGTNLYAGGGFTFPLSGASGAGAGIGRWDGNGWSAVGGGIGIGWAVFALATAGDELYAGGNFNGAGGAGGVAANNIAKWNGSNWSALGSGVAGYFGAIPVTVLAVAGNNLYAGGSFTNAGGKAANYIARAYLSPLPTLSVLRSGNDVTVRWPSTNTADFALEQSGTLPPAANWLGASATITDDGTNKSVTVPATNGQQFFRLRGP